MIWRSTALLLLAFVVAYVAIWLGPALFNAVGLGEFSCVGQFGLAILALSVLDLVFTRLTGDRSHDRGE